MSGIYPKRGRLYFRLKVDGKWKGIATAFNVGQERQARALLDRLEAQLAAGEAVDVGTGTPTVASWHPRWISARKQNVATWRNDDAVMRLHVLPSLGALRLDEVRPKHLVDLVRSWRARAGDEAMAPKSVWNCYSTLSAFFRDAALEDLVTSSPCVLTKHQLGPKVDANPEWRHTAVFGRAELEQLISDERVPMDRRVFYALEGIAGMRMGEVSGLLWRNTALQVPEHAGSLDLLLVAYSYERPFPKGEVTRPVPVHPTLAAVLAEWKIHGWRRYMGREPKPEDLVVPLPPDAVTKRGPWRRKEWVRKWFARDLEALGLRHRRGHDLRRTCISLARSDGAQKDIHKRTTHKPPREVIEGYTTFEWPVVCREVLKLQLKRHELGKVIAIPRTAAVGERATRLLPDDEAQRGIAVALPGLEPRPDSSVEGGSPATSPGVPQAYGAAGGIATGHDAGSTPITGSTVASALAAAGARFDRDGDVAALESELLELLQRLKGRR